MVVVLMATVAMLKATVIVVIIMAAVETEVAVARGLL